MVLGARLTLGQARASSTKERNVNAYTLSLGEFPQTKKRSRTLSHHSRTCAVTVGILVSNHLEIYTFCRSVSFKKKTKKVSFFGKNYLHADRVVPSPWRSLELLMNRRQRSVVSALVYFLLTSSRVPSVLIHFTQFVLSTFHSREFFDIFI